MKEESKADSEFQGGGARDWKHC